jgi:hypothetical protein
MVVGDIKQIERFSRGPIFVLGDLFQNGEDYGYEILHRLRKEGMKNQLIFELFSPVPKDFLEQMSLASPNFCLEISPESHDYEIRKACGRNYTDEAFERTIEDALDVGCGRMDVFYMTGLPKQDVKSVIDTVDYCDYLMEKFRGDKRLGLFLAPISPFLDPGSIGFENPDKFGYKVLFKSLEEHRRALASPSWKDSLNYETEWMTREQIADSAYEAIMRLIRFKEKHGIVSKELADVGVKRLEAGRDMMHRIETVLQEADSEEELLRLKPEVDGINAFPVSEKIQLELPVGFLKFRVFNWLWSRFANT